MGCGLSIVSRMAQVGFATILLLSHSETLRHFIDDKVFGKCRLRYVSVQICLNTNDVLVEIY